MVRAENLFEEYDIWLMASQQIPASENNISYMRKIFQNVNLAVDVRQSFRIVSNHVVLMNRDNLAGQLPDTLIFS